jgi:hypothetical protein
LGVPLAALRPQGSLAPSSPTCLPLPGLLRRYGPGHAPDVSH